MALDSTARLTPIQLLDGVWEGALTGVSAQTPPPALEARLGGDPIAAPQLTPMEGGWLVRLEVPAEAISDGAQVVTFHLPGSDEPLAQFAILAGDLLRADLRAEVELLRSELDLLKRAFREHCRQNAQD